MRIEYSLKSNPTEHIILEGVVSYTQTKNECLVFGSEGLHAVLIEKDIEDFSVYGLASS